MQTLHIFVADRGVKSACKIVVLLKSTKIKLSLIVAFDLANTSCAINAHRYCCPLYNNSISRNNSITHQLMDGVQVPRDGTIVGNFGASFYPRLDDQSPGLIWSCRHQSYKYDHSNK
jgi:hypothetical protein